MSVSNEYVIQVMTCPVSASGFREGIDSFARVVSEQHGADQSDEWFYREQMFSTLAANEHGQWYLTACNPLRTATRDELFPPGSWSQVKEISWRYQDFAQWPTSQECKLYHDQVLAEEGLKILGPRGPLNEMFAGTWKVGERDYKTYIQDVLKDRNQKRIDAMSRQTRLSPRSPLIGDDDSQWYGVVHGAHEVFSSALLQGSLESYVTHIPGASETACLYFSDPLKEHPYCERNVTEAVCRVQYRSTGPGEQCVAKVSSPTVFSEFEIFSNESNEWIEQEFDLGIEATPYSDWANLGVRISAADNKESRCSSIQITSIEVCITWVPE